MKVAHTHRDIEMNKTLALGKILEICYKQGNLNLVLFSCHLTVCTRDIQLSCEMSPND